MHFVALPNEIVLEVGRYLGRCAENAACPPPFQTAIGNNVLFSIFGASGLANTPIVHHLSHELRHRKPACNYICLAFRITSLRPYFQHTCHCSSSKSTPHTLMRVDSISY